MKIFGSVDTFSETSGTLRLGRLVANSSFLEALLRHGPFDLHEIFCPTEAERSRLAAHIRALPDGDALLGRCRLRLQLELPARMRECPWDVMHFGGWSRYLPALAWLRASLSPRYVPLTGIIHSLDAPSMASGLRRLLAAPIGPSDAVFCTSQDGEDAFRRQLLTVAGREGLSWNGRLEQAPLGVDERHFHPPHRDQARKRATIPGSAKVALWLGRLSAASKADLHPLLYQWKAIADKGDGNHLLVLAGGASDGDIRSLSDTARELGISGSVRILPDVDDVQKLDLLGAADVFLSPVDNHQETFGIAVVEAMAAGLPVVVSDWDGYKDLVEDGVTGIRIPVEWAPPAPDAILMRQILEPGVAQLACGQGVAPDPGALREALRSLLDSPQRAKAMGNAARERARRLFSWSAVVARHARTWESLSESARHAPVPGAGSVDPEIIDPALAFSHYGTRPPATTDEPVRLSDLGKGILEGRIPMPPTFTDLLPLSDGKLLTALVLGLRTGPRPAASHAVECARRTGRNPSEAAWLLSWLSKYGIVEKE